MFSLWPAFIHHLGLPYLYRQQFTEWSGNFLKLVSFTCILPEFSFIAFLARYFSGVPQTWRRLKLLWACFTFFKAGIQISSPGLDESCVYKHLSISLQPNHYPCKDEGSKSHEGNSSFKQISCSMCSTLRFDGKFKYCLCLSPPVYSGLPQLFEEFELC